MRRSRIGLGFIALAAAGALALSGCSTGGGNEGGGNGGTAIITANGSEPESGLIPSDTNEVGGGKILDAIFAGLFYYDADGNPVNELAESVETTDSKVFTIKIKGGTTFTNGEEVTSQSFVDAWNDAAKLSNARKNASWFSNIEGFSDTEDAPLSGLKVIDDTTFEVTLKSPQSDFPLQLGYSAFYPLPASAFDADGNVTKEFGQNPIGNGTYKVAEDGWTHKVKIDLLKNEDYAGTRTVANDGVTITFYDDAAAAYADLQSGNLDVLDQLPDSAISTFQDDLGDRAVNQPAAIFQSFTIPERLEHFSGEEGQLRREAISLAINRDQITDKIFNDTRTTAVDWSSPVINGYSTDIEGNDVLDYDPERAKELWAQADAISPWSGTFEIAYNADGGHQGWVDAVSNDLKNTLGIDAAGAPNPLFGDFRQTITDRSIQTAFRSGWQADYPGLYNFLGPLYQTGASSNDGDYSSEEVDKLLSEGLSASDLDEANDKFHQAETVLFTDLPAIPLWYQNAVGGYSENVGNVTFGWNSVPLYYEITKN
ncbi:peptide ABC transporter substrate-binding protein [Leucobacter massiliensis]|uniref:ABC transporter substrate-binding protein n=1 Tax=Leucobacter massiliensis TaxID=1686285 RepID=A0A2S9QPR2_9MICO|nr:ABC transporter substrate-binding protein [Leucobacter massiliensis]PRI11577.1 ABC transporter substrate-binding protein [Leucobacter massiliensis]